MLALCVTFSKHFQVLRIVRNPSLGMDGIDVIFKLATLDELDDVINLNQSICV